MKFYYKYVCGLREPDRLTRGIDPAAFGSVLHELVARIYKPYTGEIVNQEIIDHIHRTQSGDRGLTEDVIREVMYGGNRAPLTGTDLITSDIVSFFLKRVLEIDRVQAPFTIISLENKFEAGRQVEVRGETRHYRLGGKIDRIDEREGVRRLIDYKTGRAESGIKTVDQLFDSESKELNEAVVQTMIYCSVMEGRKGYEKLRPVIYGLRAEADEGFKDFLTIGDSKLEEFSAISAEFGEMLDNTVRDIFDPGIPFIMTAHKSRCSYCPYRKLCQR